VLAGLFSFHTSNLKEIPMTRILMLLSILLSLAGCGGGGTTEPDTPEAAQLEDRLNERAFVQAQLACMPQQLFDFHYRPDSGVWQGKCSDGRKVTGTVLP
jgi:hypothetical protein